MNATYNKQNIFLLQETMLKCVHSTPIDEGIRESRKAAVFEPTQAPVPATFPATHIREKISSTDLN